MRTRLDSDLDIIQREAQLRRIGRDLHDQAASISPETVDALAAVLLNLARTTEPEYRKGYDILNIHYQFIVALGGALLAWFTWRSSSTLADPAQVLQMSIAGFAGASAGLVAMKTVLPEPATPD